MNLQDFAALARARRTNMQVDRERPVDRALVEQLCELAQWAPNHKRTWPWNFAVADGDGRARLGNAIADAMAAHGDPEEKVAKAREKYLRTPTLLVVGSAAGESVLRTSENRDAVAAGIQNVLLGATAAGLGSYWASCPDGAHEAVDQVCGFPEGTYVVGIIYLGHHAKDAAVPERPPVLLRTVGA